jgi:hypothetical protein
MEYRETQTSILLTSLLVISLAGTALAGWWAVTLEPRATVWAAVSGVTLLVLLVTFSFVRLTVRINADGVRVAFGPFSRTVAWQDIKDAEAAPYKWLQFGGWGWRLDGKGGQAWSLPGYKDQVILHLHSGKRVHFTTANAPAALDAINEHRP